MKSCITFFTIFYCCVFAFSQPKTPNSTSKNPTNPPCQNVIPNHTWAYTDELGWVYSHGNNWFSSYSSDGDESVNMNVYLITTQNFCGVDVVWGFTAELGWIYFEDATASCYIDALDIWASFNAPPSSQGIWFLTSDTICGYTDWFYASESSSQSGYLFSDSGNNWIQKTFCPSVKTVTPFALDATPNELTIPEKKTNTLLRDEPLTISNYNSKQLDRMPTNANQQPSQ